VPFLAGADAGQTPLDGDELDGLIPSWVVTHEDLNRAEEDNITRAVIWAAGRTFTPREILTESFIRQSHHRMFALVWRWAGTYRTTNKNIGAEHWLIVEQVAGLLGDAIYWVDNQVYEGDELAVRFHHRLVQIHPFANGNGRASRELADLLVASLGGVRFSWGAALAADDPAEARRLYIEALRAADAGDIEPLTAFARS
jgi:Fic-DOC domain mobile mystery protein B